MKQGAGNVRFAEVDVETDRGRVHVVLGLDRGTHCDFRSPYPVFEAMVRETVTRARFDLGLSIERDQTIDDHGHSEIVGFALGRAFRESVENSGDVVGSGSSVVPCGDSLVQVALDLAGPAHCFFDVPFARENIGGFGTESVNVFFDSFARGCSMSLHVRKISGSNDRNTIDAAFRALGMSLRNAV